MFWTFGNIGNLVLFIFCLPAIMENVKSQTLSIFSERLEMCFLMFPCDPGNVGKLVAKISCLFVLKPDFWKSFSTLKSHPCYPSFKRWLCSPNHYPQQTRIEILCRLVASMSKYLRSEINFSRKSNTYFFLARMST